MNEQRYYSEKLSAERLRKCYEVAPPRVRQYLKAEISFIIANIRPEDFVLELGCGYGRVLVPLMGRVRRVVGIDSSIESLRFGHELTGGPPRCHFAAMDAGSLAFETGSFDLVLCIQNGISAFKVDRQHLVAEAIRVTRKGGTAVFSSYAEKFWEPRLEWFRIQAAHGLLGEIDEDATGDGVIVCKDGFRAETVGPEEFKALARQAGVDCKITEIDESSLFCVMTA